MNTIIKLLVIAFFVAAIGLLMHKAEGKSQTQNFIDFKEDLNIIKANEATNHPTPIYEDQFIVCNMWEVCQVIDIDDYMTRSASDQLWNNFDKDLDTFDIKDVTN